MSASERQALCDAARSFHARGYAFGSTGNVSIRGGDSIWVTPTGFALDRVSADGLAQVGMDGAVIGSVKPSKEYPFHLEAYRNAGEHASALVHLHSTWAVALSCLEELSDAEPLPVFTPYYLMRVAPLAVVPYYRPGSQQLAEAVGKAAARHDCLLLRNHGLIALGGSMAEAVDRAEELEETAKLFFILRNDKIRLLSEGEQSDIHRTFPKAR